MTEKLTKRLIDTLDYIGDGTSRDIRWDTDITGFGIRLYPSGKKAFILSCRQNGTKRLFISLYKGLRLLCGMPYMMPFLKKQDPFHGMIMFRLIPIANKTFKMPEIKSKERMVR